MFSRVPTENNKDGKDLEAKSYEEELKELGMFVLKKRRLRGNTGVVFQYMKSRGCGFFLNGTQE